MYFFRQNTQISALSVDLAKCCSQIAENESMDLDFMSVIEQIFKSLACMNGSFLAVGNAHLGCSSKNPGINIDQIENTFELIRKIENANLKQIVSEIICPNRRTDLLTN